jgi:hypothetical protein
VAFSAPASDAALVARDRREPPPRIHGALVTPAICPRRSGAAQVDSDADEAGVTTAAAEPDPLDRSP